MSKHEYIIILHAHLNIFLCIDSYKLCIQFCIYHKSNYHTLITS